MQALADDAPHGQGRTGPGRGVVSYHCTPLSDGRSRYADSTAVCEAGPRRGQGAYGAQRMCLRLSGSASAAERGAAQRKAVPQGSRRRIVSAEHGVHHLHDRDVGHPRHQDVHELLAGGHHVERPPHLL
ncbi:hypothetical protein, partial [Streptomyces sp. NPDC056387]|uniref:hypothetical protein n=1 Tax=Streptomyces sp. NPDC056387 TaxID=3345803 RepID=UPI0035D84162